MQTPKSRHGYTETENPAGAWAQATANLDLGVVNVRDLIDRGSTPEDAEARTMMALMANLPSIPINMALGLYARMIAAGQMRLATMAVNPEGNPGLRAGVDHAAERLAAGQPELEVWLEVAQGHCDDVVGMTHREAAAHLATLVAAAQRVLAQHLDHS